MIFLKIAVTLCATIFSVQADVGPGQNAYLPPDKGYAYPKPNKPFPSPPRPTRPPTFTPSYTPPATRPPAFTTPRPSYGPPPVTQPPYRPPSFTPGPTPSRPVTTFRPGPTPTPFRPTPTVPSYRPPGPTPSRPPYRPPYDGQPTSGHDHHAHQDHDHGHDHHHHEPGMPFDFAYAVQDAEHGNDYSHNAVSDGDVTRGEYRIQLPDGRTQIVKYTADWKNGFNAQVSFEGNPTYPNYQGSGSNQQGGGYKY